MATKAIDPLPDRLPADRHAAFREKIFNISGAERKAMIDPDGICDDLARKTKPLKARQLGRYLYAWGLSSSVRANKLAMPLKAISGFL